jgi:hypothetical protein
MCNLLYIYLNIVLQSTYTNCEITANSRSLIIRIYLHKNTTKSFGDLIMRLSSIGLIGGALLAGAVSAAPAFAGGLSASATFITPAGFTSTVSGEVILPSGAFYSPAAISVLTPGTPVTKASITNSSLIVVPQFSLQGFSVAVESLSVGSNGVVSVLPGASFTAAAATVLTSAAAAANPTANGAEFLDPITGLRIYNSSNIEFISAIIKAGAGVNGLD